ncbi:hypothetical protein MJI95_37170, partial [Salmonella enterica subsp. enterica serovar Kentucky]|nr:hypothetical protein [Salmonella enterica subsp. enterica serovar Kentucky]
SVDAIRRHVESNGGHFPADVEQNVENVARLGATPLVVVEGARDIPANANTPKAPPAPPAPARVSTLLDWVPGVRAIAVKCDLCS